MRILIFTGIVAAVLSIISTALIEWVKPAFVIIPGFLRFTMHLNPGIAYGLQLPEGLQVWAILMALLVVVFFALQSKRDLLQDIGFGLIVGGAAGNIVDRIQDGFVTDFISIGTFPTFNIADACISIGIGILVVEEMRKWRVDKK